MKNTITLYLQTAVILLTATLTGPVARAGEVPFKGSMQGAFAVTPLAPPLAFILTEGTGNATHLGRFTVEKPHIVNFATLTAVGSITFTAANSDTLTADFTVVATPTENPDVVSFVETATITGGTGRFAGATGCYTFTGWADSATASTGGSFEGTIVLAKKK